MRLIDADALKEAIGDIYGLSFEEMIEDFTWLKAIDNAPTIPLPDFKAGYKQAIIDGRTNYSRPQGEWITNNWGETYCKCGFPALYDEFGLEIKSNFCPNCGADMRKEAT